MSLTRPATLWRARLGFRQLARGVQTRAQVEHTSRNDENGNSAYDGPASVATPRQVCDISTCEGAKLMSSPTPDPRT